MAARVCQDCSTSFPPVSDEECLVCGGRTILRQYVAVDPDWEKKVKDAEGKPDLSLSKEALWRRDRLLEAGYNDNQALFLALAREVDLHKANSLAEAAGPDMAFRILS